MHAVLIDDMRPQNDAVPVVAQIVEMPALTTNRLGAELLGQRDTDGLELSIGVIRTDRDPETVVSMKEHDLGLAAGTGADDLNCFRLSEQRSRDAIVHWRRSWARDANLLELTDVFLHRIRVACCPA